MRHERWCRTSPLGTVNKMERALAVCFSVLVAGALGGGCTVNPQPDPALDLSRVEYTQLELKGRIGAVLPHEATEIAFIVLDNPNPPIKIPVAGDGSFTTPFSTTVGTIRALAFLGEQPVGEPVDFLREPTSDTAILADPASPCVTLERLRVLDSIDAGTSATGRVRLRNDCGGDVSVALSWRRGDQGFSLEGPAVSVVQSGEGIDLNFRFAPPDGLNRMDELVATIDDGAGAADDWVSIVGLVR